VRADIRRDRANVSDAARRTDATDPRAARQIRITHPFHPWCGQSFPFVVAKQLWGEERVTLQLPDGAPYSVPLSWTDVLPADPYVSLGGGRSRFRVEDLLALADLLAARGRR